MIEDFRITVFLSVAAEGSFTKAARALDISQPAVSQNISSLEKELGTPLFTRGHGIAELTSGGRDFLPRAKSIHNACTAALEAFNSGKIHSRIDHEKLLRGIYVFRKEIIGGEVVTTFDIRMKEPNREPALGIAAIHTIDCLAKAHLRSHPVWGNKVVMWGAMSCLTGTYLLIRGDWTPMEIAPLITDIFKYISDFDGEIPGATPRESGNYLLNDLPMARYEAQKFLHEVLENLTEENLNYPC